MFSAPVGVLTLEEYEEKGRVVKERMLGIESRIGYSFRRKDFLYASLTDRSAALFPQRVLSQRKLEAEGDDLLEAVVKDYTHDFSLPGPIGVFYNSNVHLARAGFELGVQDYLFSLHSKALNPHPERQLRLIANAIEALIAALYHDGGESAARWFVKEYLLECEGIYHWSDIHDLFGERGGAAKALDRLYKHPVNVLVARNEIQATLYNRYNVVVSRGDEQYPYVRACSALARGHPWAWYGMEKPCVLNLPLSRESTVEERMLAAAPFYKERTYTPEYIEETPNKKFHVEVTWERYELSPRAADSSATRGQYIDKLRHVEPFSHSDLIVYAETQRKGGTIFAFFVGDEKLFVSEPCRSVNEAARQALRCSEDKKPSA